MLELSSISLARNGQTLLQDLSFKLEPGEALLLKGPNGIGKTSLLRAIAGLSNIAKGTIRGAEDTTVLATHADGLKAQLTVAENLRFWSDIYRTDRTSQAVAAFDLTPLMQRRPMALSAGQKRRVGLARLLLADRPIWLLDEPTVSLDFATTERFSEIVTAHLKSGGSALIATHIDMNIKAQTLDLAAFKPTQDAYEADEMWL